MDKKVDPLLEKLQPGEEFKVVYGHRYQKVDGNSVKCVTSGCTHMNQIRSVEEGSFGKIYPVT